MGKLKNRIKLISIGGLILFMSACSSNESNKNISIEPMNYLLSYHSTSTFTETAASNKGIYSVHDAELFFYDYSTSKTVKLMSLSLFDDKEITNSQQMEKASNNISPKNYSNLYDGSLFQYYDDHLFYTTAYTNIEGKSEIQIIRADETGKNADVLYRLDYPIYSAKITFGKLFYISSIDQCGYIVDLNALDTPPTKIALESPNESINSMIPSNDGLYIQTIAKDVTPKDYCKYKLYKYQDDGSFKPILDEVKELSAAYDKQLLVADGNFLTSNKYGLVLQDEAGTQKMKMNKVWVGYISDEGIYTNSIAYDYITKDYGCANTLDTSIIYKFLDTKTKKEYEYTIRLDEDPKNPILMASNIIGVLNQQILISEEYADKVVFKIIDIKTKKSTTVFDFQTKLGS